MIPDETLDQWRDEATTTMMTAGPADFQLDIYSGRIMALVAEVVLLSGELQRLLDQVEKIASNYERWGGYIHREGAAEDIRQVTYRHFYRMSDDCEHNESPGDCNDCE